MFLFDGRRFILSAPIIGIENGWVAVDSCAVGMHALVELEVEARRRGHVPTMLGDMALGLG